MLPRKSQSQRSLSIFKPLQPTDRTNDTPEMGRFFRVPENSISEDVVAESTRRLTPQVARNNYKISARPDGPSPGLQHVRRCCEHSLRVSKRIHGERYVPGSRRFRGCRSL